MFGKLEKLASLINKSKCTVKQGLQQTLKQSLPSGDIDQYRPGIYANLLNISDNQRFFVLIF